MDEYTAQIKAKRKACHGMKYEGDQHKPKTKGYDEELDDMD
jgi:hypothetical protein